MKKNLLITGSAIYLIPLYKGDKILCFSYVSDKYYDDIKKYKWYLNDKGYAERRISIKKPNGKYGRIITLMHRAILNAPKELEVDHINLDRIDNREDNLRLVTRRENMFNKNMYENNKVGYKGVYMKSGTYRAEIGFEGESICLGTYNDVRDAALAYNIKALDLFGEYANLNILDEEFTNNNKDRINNIIKNVGKPKSSTGYWGVFYEKRSGKYVPEISKDGKKHWLGKFKIAKDAAIAYNFKAVELFGDKARLNVIEND